MKLTMMKGLPASGKTTAAREIVNSSGNTGRINRDDLRAMLFDSKWSGKREQVVVDVEKAIADVLFRHKMNAVVDDTNLTPKHLQMWKQAAKDCQAQFTQEDLTNIPWPECVIRDAFRGRPVGRPVIQLMAARAGLIDWGSKPLIIVDIDGTLADGDHRVHHVQKEPKDWKSYFDLMHLDKPIKIVIDMVHEMRKENTIVIVSGRSDEYYQQTKHWLEDNDVVFDHIFMRAASDKRPDTMVKQDILDALPREKIALVLDDRPSVIVMWKMNGLRVIPVRGACEDF